MLLLARSQLPKLLLRNALDESLQSAHDLLDTLPIQRLAHRLLNQRFNLHQTLPVQVVAQPILHLCQHMPQKPVAVRLVLDVPRVKRLVDEARGEQLVVCNALAHDERLVGFGEAQAPHEADGCVAFGYEAERGKRCEEEGVRRAVDEVREADECGREADGGAVERCDEDFGV